MKTSARAIGAITGINPSILLQILVSASGGNCSGRLTSGATTSIVPIPLLIGLDSPSGYKFHERAEPRLERPSIAVGVPSYVHLGSVPVRLDHRPHPLVREEKHAAQRQHDPSESDIHRCSPRIVLYCQDVRRGDLLKILEDDFVTGDQQRIIFTVFRLAVKTISYCRVE